MSCETIQQDSTVASGIIQPPLSVSLVSLHILAPLKIVSWKCFVRFTVMIMTKIKLYIKDTGVCSAGHRQDFLLPDRSKYVNMEKLFLRSYMDLLVQTCHRRGALATGGMAALLLPQDPLTDSYKTVLSSVIRQDTTVHI